MNTSCRGELGCDRWLYREWNICHTGRTHCWATCEDRACEDLGSDSISREMPRGVSPLWSRPRTRYDHRLQFSFEPQVYQFPDQHLSRFSDWSPVALRTAPHTGRRHVPYPRGSLRRATELAHRDREDEGTYSDHESPRSPHIRKDTLEGINRLELGPPCLSHDDPRCYDRSRRDDDHQCRIYRTRIWEHHREDRKTRRCYRESVVYLISSYFCHSDEGGISFKLILWEVYKFILIIPIKRDSSALLRNDKNWIVNNI